MKDLLDNLILNISNYNSGEPPKPGVIVVHCDQDPEEFTETPNVCCDLTNNVQQCQKLNIDQSILEKVLELLQNVLEELLKIYAEKFNVESILKLDPQQTIKTALLSFAVDSLKAGLKKELDRWFKYDPNKPNNAVRENIGKVLTILFKTYVMLPGPTPMQTYLIKSTVVGIDSATEFKNLQMFIVGTFVAKLKENVKFFNTEQPLSQ